MTVRLHWIFLLWGLFELLDAEANTGISLTENFAMYPTAAVSGFYFGHPQAEYFGVARVGRDQLEDYATRRNVDIATAERWLRPNLESFPGRDSYLVADADRAAALRDQYRDGTDDRLIGIAWVSKNKRIGPQKSMTLMELAQLTGIPGIRFIDLQYGDTAGERAQFGDETGTSIVHDDSIDQMADLDAFAAQVAAMDLVIAVDNSTIQVSGAQGIPTFTLLSHAPEWRFGLAGDGHDWHPSLRVFRQSQPGRWEDVFERLAEAFGRLLDTG